MYPPSLWARFQNLKPTVDGEAVAAIRCGTADEHLLIRGARGEPALLLSSEPRKMPRADIRLKHVGVQFDRKFEIERSDERSVEVGHFCKFTCDPNSPHLYQYFVELMAASASAHQGMLNQTILDEVVDALLELFRKLSLPADNSVKGLWGELLLIHLAQLPGNFVDAWHMRTSDGFDFSFTNMRIEVKTTERSSREHEFSIKQVRSGRSTDLVASVTLSRSSSGLSNLDLARLIAERLDAVQQGKLWRLLIETLGDDCDIEQDQRYDVKSATETLKFVRAMDVPAPEVSESAAPFISEVSFRSNLDVLCATSALVTKTILGSSTPIIEELTESQQCKDRAWP